MWKDKIDRYIEEHRAELVEDIFKLCRINSERMPAEEGKPLGAGVSRALELADAMVSSYGFSAKNYDNYVLAVDLGGAEPRLDILTHLDVVPEGDGWSVTKAFEPVLKDGRIYARGAADNKGPAVAALYALRAVKELGIPLSKRCRLIFGTDEESGFSDIQHYYSIEKEAPMTFAPDLTFPVINVEKGPIGVDFEAEFPSCRDLPRLCSFDCGVKGNVVPGEACAVVEAVDRGVLEETAGKLTREIGVEFVLEPMGENRTRITAIGVGCHASRCDEGNNALTALLTYLDRLPLAPCEQVHLLHDLLALMPHADVTGEHLGVAMRDELSGHLSLAFTMLSVDENRLSGHYDSRCPICATEDNYLKVARERMEAIGVRWTNVNAKAPHHIPEDSPFVQELLQVYADYTGRPKECQYRGGYTYVHGLKNGVAFGAAMPETENRMHAADESAVLDELLVSAKIFAQVIVDLCA